MVPIAAEGSHHSTLLAGQIAIEEFLGLVALNRVALLETVGRCDLMAPADSQIPGSVFVDL